MSKKNRGQCEAEAVETSVENAIDASMTVLNPLAISALNVGGVELDSVAKAHVLTNAVSSVGAISSSMTNITLQALCRELEAKIAELQKKDLAEAAKDLHAKEEVLEKARSKALDVAKKEVLEKATAARTAFAKIACIDLRQPTATTNMQEDGSVECEFFIRHDSDENRRRNINATFEFKSIYTTKPDKAVVSAQADVNAATKKLMAVKQHIFRIKDRLACRGELKEQMLALSTENLMNSAGMSESVKKAKADASVQAAHILKNLE